MKILFKTLLRWFVKFWLIMFFFGAMFQIQQVVFGSGHLF